ncbi:MAG: cupin domain-containing protein [Actinobacteria bacterium]|nr:cupin domain-containing protein [Actinomycetota bacterium]
MDGGIENPRTGQRMTFVTDRPELLEIDTINPPTEVREPEHVHPKQESGARVSAGSLRFEVDGVERSVGPGEAITIPADTPHHFWNDGDGAAHAVQWFRPALKTRAFFETLFALANDGKLDAKGMPSLLQIAVMIPEFSDELRPTSPPWALQRAISATLAPIARRRGYSPYYGQRASSL